jgi:hypothetical protein
MNMIVTCPGCGFSGRLPASLAGLRSVICPNCKTAVPIEQVRARSMPAPDDTFPIWVDGTPGSTGTPVSPALPAPRTGAVEALPEPDEYPGDYMKEEAARFTQYVAARLNDLHKRRAELATAESRFETATMEQKQEIYRGRGAIVAEAERLKARGAELQTKETALVARETELATREAEVAAREGRVARSEARAADTDRRTAELRAAIDQLDARRVTLTEERERLNKRAEELDRAELALHRRSAELDEMDERLRLEQEEFEHERVLEQAARAAQVAHAEQATHADHTDQDTLETPALVAAESVPYRAAPIPPPLPPLLPPHQ